MLSGIFEFDCFRIASKYISIREAQHVRVFFLGGGGGGREAKVG